MEPKQRFVYCVEISPEASQDLGALQDDARDAIHDALDALETEHRPAGARPGALPGHFVLRVGEHEILYAANQEARLITVKRIIPYCADHSDRGEEPGS